MHEKAYANAQGDVSFLGFPTHSYDVNVAAPY